MPFDEKVHAFLKTKILVGMTELLCKQNIGQNDELFYKKTLFETILKKCLRTEYDSFW